MLEIMKKENATGVSGAEAPNVTSGFPFYDSVHKFAIVWFLIGRSIIGSLKKGSGGHFSKPKL